MKIKYVHILILLTIINMIGGLTLIASSIYNNSMKKKIGEYTSYTNFTDIGLVAMSAALAVLGSCIGAGIALSAVASAGFAASVEKPELKSYMLLLGGLAEGIAIYGLLIAILIIGKI